MASPSLSLWKVWSRFKLWIIRRREITLTPWYLVVMALTVVWVGIMQVVSFPEYLEYARNVIENMGSVFAQVPVTTVTPPRLAVFQWSSTVLALLILYRQWARRQFKWMIGTFVVCLLFVPYVVYVVHEIIDQHKEASLS